MPPRPIRTGFSGAPMSIKVNLSDPEDRKEGTKGTGTKGTLVFYGHQGGTKGTLGGTKGTLVF